jgi:hypothetical protein
LLIRIYFFGLHFLNHLSPDKIIKGLTHN